MSDTRHGVIYSLSDESGIRYIGQTNNSIIRLRQHCSIAQNRGDTKLNRWITKLLIKRGISPIFNVIEKTNELDEREKYWIAYYKEKGVNLLNMTDGGYDWRFLRRKKIEKLWGNTHSPVQRRLKCISETIRFFIRNRNEEIVKHLEKRLVVVNQIIKEHGLAKVNLYLYEKYGS